VPFIGKYTSRPALCDANNGRTNRLRGGESWPVAKGNECYSEIILISSGNGCRFRDERSARKQSQSQFGLVGFTQIFCLFQEPGKEVYGPRKLLVLVEIRLLLKPLRRKTEQTQQVGTIQKVRTVTLRSISKDDGVQIRIHDIPSFSGQRDGHIAHNQSIVFHFEERFGVFSLQWECSQIVKQVVAEIYHQEYDQGSI